MKKLAIVAGVVIGVVGVVLIVHARATAKADDVKQHHAQHGGQDHYRTKGQAGHSDRPSVR